MIEFFRHIRQRMINENRFSMPTGRLARYFLYAIGEIPANGSGLAGGDRDSDRIADPLLAASYMSLCSKPRRDDMLVEFGHRPSMLLQSRRDVIWVTPPTLTLTQSHRDAI